MKNLFYRFCNISKRNLFVPSSDVAAGVQCLLFSETSSSNIEQWMQIKFSESLPFSIERYLNFSVCILANFTAKTFWNFSMIKHLYSGGDLFFKCIRYTFEKKFASRILKSFFFSISKRLFERWKIPMLVDFAHSLTVYKQRQQYPSIVRW